MPPVTEAKYKDGYEPISSHGTPYRASRRVTVGAKYPNLKPWLPGQSGNPAGRKTGSKNISTLVKEILAQDADEALLTKSGLTELVRDAPTSYAKAMILAAISKALKGNMQAINWLAEQQTQEGEAIESACQEPILISRIKPRKFTVD